MTPPESREDIGHLGGVVARQDVDAGVDVLDPLHLPADLEVHLLTMGAEEPAPGAGGRHRG